MLWRHQQFLSQQSLAMLLGVHINTISNWEKGVHRIPELTELALEQITQQRASQVRKLRTKKEQLAHQRRLKAIDQDLAGRRAAFKSGVEAGRKAAQA